MTREEALMRILKERGEGDKIHYSIVYEIINEIFDDIESRTCENCKYYKEEGNYCNNEENEIFEFDNYKKMKVPDWKFSCNRFERKKDEKD